MGKNSSNEVKKCRFRIGVLVDSLDKDFQTQVLDGILSVCEERDFQILLISGAQHFSKSERQREYHFVKKSIHKDEINALIIFAGSITEDFSISSLSQILKEIPAMPMVSIASELPGIPSIVVDNTGGIECVMKHFIEFHGYKRIAFFRGPELHEEAQVRFDAYRNTLKRYSMPYEENMVIQCDNFSEESGKKAVKDLLKANNTPVDVILAADDSIAMGAMEELRNRGIPIPDEIAVAGFDNLEKAESSFPSLTTVSQSFFQQGVEAVNLIQSLEAGESVEPLNVLSTSLIIRNSCGCKGSYTQTEERDISSLEHSEEKDKSLYYLKDLIIKAINEGSSDFFLEAFEAELVKDLSMGNSLAYWRGLLKMVHQNILEDFRNIPLQSIEIIQHRANEILIRYLCREHKEKAIVDQKERHRLHVLSHNLLTTFGIKKLIKIFEERITALRIKECYLALYRKEDIPIISDSEEGYPEEVELLLAIQDGETIINPEDSIRFNTTSLLPDVCLVRDIHKNLVFLPLCFNRERYGYMLLEYNPDISINIYDTLIINLSSAIHSSLLMEEIEKDAENRSNFFINIAHEIKTPLTITRNYIDKYIQNPMDLNDLKIAKQNVQKLSKDMANFMDNERMERGLFSVSETKIVNLSEYMDNTVRLFREIAKEDSISIDFSPSENYFISIDPHGLDRILNNLLDNAVGYNHHGGSISIELSLKDLRVNLLISNTGYPISKDQQESIFKPFYQAPQVKRGHGGIGMGLAIVKKMTESAKGTIELLEDPQRTSFLLSFPAETPPSDWQDENTIYDSNLVEGNNIIIPAIESNRWDSKKHTLLIIEYNKQMLSLLVNSLKDRYNVVWAETGIEALALISQGNKPDLIISDILMEPMDGFQVVDEIRKIPESAGIPLLFISAKDQESTRIRALNLGALDFIRKPFAMEEVQAKIKNLLSYRDSIEANLRQSLETGILRMAKEWERNKYSTSKDYSTNFRLSKKEQQVIELIKEGKIYKEIAETMGVSVNTTKSHIYRIYKKCGINNRIELINLSI